MTLKDTIQARLTEFFQPTFLLISDESHQHHHGGVETHFTIRLVSQAFEGQSRLQRHRAVQKVLADELTRLKACCLQTLTLEEYEKESPTRAPYCVGHG